MWVAISTAVNKELEKQKLSVQMKVQPRQEDVRDGAKLLGFLQRTGIRHGLFLRLARSPGLSELTNYSSLEHQLPLSCPLPGLYTTPVHTIILLWIFMAGSKSLRCRQVAVIRIQGRLPFSPSIASLSTESCKTWGAAQLLNVWLQIRPPQLSGRLCNLNCSITQK